MEVPWILLKRLVGLFLPTPVDEMEGQLRYSRDGAVDGKLYVARKLSGGTNEWMEVANAAAGTFAPNTAKYITQVADATLTNEQSLGALSTGILKSTTTTGVLSIAVGADLPSHTHVESDVTSLVSDLALKANKSDNLSVFAATTSLQLKGVISDETGSGALVFANSPALVTPTGIVKGDVGLGNVDNTSDATKNAAAVTLTNKTITAPVIATIVNTGTLTLPTSTDTLVGKATTDVLSNKTLNNTNTVVVKGTNFTLQDNGDTTKQAGFLLNGLTTGVARTLTLPDASITLVGNDNTATLTNKTLTGPAITTPVISLHLHTSGTTPTVAANANIGNTGAASITEGNDISFRLQIIPGGAGITTGTQCTVTFNLAHPTTSYGVQVSPVSDAAGTLGTVFHATNRVTNTVDFRTTVALTSGSTYQWDVQVFYRA